MEKIPPLGLKGYTIPMLEDSINALGFQIDKDAFGRPCFELIQQFEPGTNVVFNTEADRIIEVTILEKSITFLVTKGNKKGLKIQVQKPQGKISKMGFKKILYIFLCEYYERSLNWGILTGIKPVKLAMDILINANNREEGVAKFIDTYGTSKEKANLALEIAEIEKDFIYPVEQDKISVYVGIPICPSKCSYCSFVSTLADAQGKKQLDYLNNLIIEIEKTKELIAQRNLVVDTLYIGGGTPSILKAEELQRLFKSLEGNLIHPKLREFTFEAGRPDTITKEKLKIIHDAGVHRICLNPQSMNHKTLQDINRKHSPEDIKRLYAMMRELGFKTINMDLIVGLDNESEEALHHSLDEVLHLAPENLTIHSLAIKKGAVMRETQGTQVQQLYPDELYRRLENKMRSFGYFPYYMYRQKYTQGNGENIGYTKAGHEGIYNILIMAEKQTILGIGAGSSGKIYHLKEDRFEKVFTVKDVKTYNENFEEILNKKFKAYENLPQF